MAAILKRAENGVVAGRGRRWAVCVVIFALWAGPGGAARADDAGASTNGVGAPPAPLVPPPRLPPLPSALSTNPGSSTFLQLHPEVAAPAPGEQPGLSLRPDTSGSNAPPEIIGPEGPDTSMSFLRESNPVAEGEDLAAHLLVVYNTNDGESKGLAEYYAERRKIPAERVFGIAAPLTEEITRAQYDETIRSPIVSYLTRNDWMVREPERAQIGARALDLLVATRNDIWAIVLMRGVPLKIAPDPSDEDGMEDAPELQTNAAAVDSELALLPVFGLPKGGYVPNIFFDDRIAGIKRLGPALARSMVLVTRLDGPKASDVRRMIDECLDAEKNRLAGLAVIDSRGITDAKNNYLIGDAWLRSARDLLVKEGWEVKFDDKPEVLPATDPCNRVALYLGWYNEGATGPWVTAPKRFVPGAIAYHLHSFSATTVRSATAGWVGPLIAHGADATMGMVYEPYLGLTPHLDIFTRRLLNGDYFAEAAYASMPGLSWMETVVGDPLYRPFRAPLDPAPAAAGVPHTEHDDWLFLQEARREIATGRMEATTDNLERALNVPGAGPVAEEGLGDLLEKLNEAAAGSCAEEAYKKALAGERVGVDRIRVGLKLAQCYSNRGEEARARAELESLREADPEEAQRFGVSPALDLTPVAPVNSAGGDKPSALPRPPSPPKPTPVSQ